MMMLLLMRKKLPSSLLLLPSLTIHRTILSHLPVRCFSASATQNPSPKPHFMVDYLVKSFGFSVEKATKISKPLAHLKSPDKPDSVVLFLKLHGFDNTRIKRLVSANPLMLCYSVDETLAPNMEALIDMGFSGLGLQELIVSNPNALILRRIVPRIGFWRTLLGNDQKKLQLLFKKNRSLINQDIVSSIAPKIALLKNYGLSDRQIEKGMLLGNAMIARSMASTEALLKRTLEFGFRCSSMMFVHGLFALGAHGRAAFKAKMDLLRSYGWSEREFISAFQKAPTITHLSETNLRAKMEFLMERAGCTPSYIALHPMLLAFSMEKRLMPRHQVLQILNTKGVVKKTQDFKSIMSFSEKIFVEKFILRYREEAPELLASYSAACAGNIPIGPKSFK